VISEIQELGFGKELVFSTEEISRPQEEMFLGFRFLVACSVLRQYR